MVYTTPLLFLVAIASVSASPVETRAKSLAIPLKHSSNVKNIKNLVERGRQRIEKYNGRGDNTNAASGAVTNEDVSYIANVGVGNGKYDLIVDTGSSNTWIGAGASYQPSSSSRNTGGSVQVSYGSGSFSGTEYTDKVSFAGLTVPKQSFGVASQTQGFTGVDGIFGVGPVDLTQGTVSNANTVPTFLDNLYSLGLISTEVLGVSFKPESGSDSADTNGELTLGGTDTSKYSAPLTYFPTTKSGDSSYYWGISIASFKYGSTTLASGGSGIVDTGTTLIYIPTGAYNKFLSATGGTTDQNSGLASFTRKPTSNFVITFGSTAYTLTPAQYLVPTAQYGNFELTSGKYYAWINDGGTSSVNTIIGQKFLENYYSVYDTTNARIGFAANK